MTVIMNLTQDQVDVVAGYLASDDYAGGYRLRKRFYKRLISKWEYGDHCDCQIV